MGEFIELETVRGGGGEGDTKFLDGYHLVVIRGVEEVQSKVKDRQRAPTIEVLPAAKKYCQPELVAECETG